MEKVNGVGLTRGLREGCFIKSVNKELYFYKLKWIVIWIFDYNINDLLGCVGFFAGSLTIGIFYFIGNHSAPYFLKKVRLNIRFYVY